MRRVVGFSAACIADVCEAIIDCVNKTAPTVDDETPFKMIRTTNVRDGWITLDEVRYVTAEVFERWNRRATPRKGDVILTREAPLGEVGMLRADDRVFLGQRLVLYRANPTKLDNHFLLYALRTDSVRSQIMSYGSGATVEHMRVPDCEKLILNLPPLEYQRRVGRILSAYDDLIENNTERIKILEDMAQMLYREWFVNFRFPGHEKVRLVDSELGPIPQGWKTGPLKSVCDRVTDGSHWSPTTVESGRPMASSKDMHRWGLNLATCRMISDGDFDELVRNDCRPLAGDVLITKDGANYLKYCFAVEKDMDVVVLSSVAMIRPNPAEASSQYIEFHLSDGSVKTRLAGRVSGAAIPRIVLTDFRHFTILVPPIAIQRRFEQLVQPFVALCWRLIDKNTNLRTTRDFLLPKLISGEIPIEAADQAAELMEEIAQPA